MERLHFLQIEMQKTPVKQIFLSDLLSINSFILHITLHWGTGNTGARIEVAGLSPSSESTEYLETYLSYIDTIIPVYFTIGVVLLSHMRKLKPLNGLGILRGFKGLTIVIIFSIFVCTLIEPRKTIPYYFIDKYFYPVDMEKLRIRDKTIDLIKNKFTPSINNYNKIAIIIGESANKNRMGVYGYKSPTTPFLTRAMENENSFIFDAISPTNQTRYSIPIMLTDATVDDYDKFFSSPSILTEFRQFGYKTYWFSNQGRVGKYDNAITNISKEANVAKIENLVYRDAKKDSSILKYIEDLDLHTNTKELFIFQLMGSHLSYPERYDKDTALIKKPINSSDDYDNSIHYTDIIIENIYDSFPKNNFLFVYVSDHGEVVRKGHGFLPPFRDEYEIPLVVLSSHKNSFLDEMKNLNKASIFNTEGFNDFIKSIAGINEERKKISTKEHIFSVSPQNIYRFKDTPNYKEGDRLIQIQ